MILSLTHKASVVFGLILLSVVFHAQNVQYNHDELLKLESTLQGFTSKTEGDSINLAQLHHDIGDIQLNYTLEYNKALEHFALGLGIAEKYKDTSLTINFLRKIGYAQYVLGDAEATLRYYNEAITLSELIGDRNTGQEIRLYLGDMFESTGDTLKAIECYKNILDHFDQTQQDGKLTAAVARYYNLTNNYIKAIEFNNQALKIFIKKEDYRWTSFLYSEQALLYLKIDKPDDAEVFSKKALAVSKKYKLIKELYDAYKAMALVSEAQGDYKLSLEYQKLAVSLKDSIYAEKNISHVGLLEAQMNTKRIEEKIAALNKEKEIQFAEIKAKRITFYSLLVVASLVMLFSLVIYGRFKLIKKQANEIEKKNIILNDLYNEQNILLKEKVTLLKEVHHRVKNNMQVINSLLMLQSNTIEDEQIKGIFKTSQNRIYSMAMVHEMLYSHGDLSNIEFAKYVDQLVDQLTNTYTENKNISYHLSIPTTEFDIELAVPLGLLINEIITNSLKYAFPDNREGIIEVELTKENNINVLYVTDNGVGTNISNLTESTGLGHELIASLIDQINGELELSTENGLRYKIIFPDYRPNRLPSE